MIRHKQGGVSIVFGVLLGAAANTYAVSLSYPDTSNTVGEEGDSPRYIISENLDGLNQTDIVVSHYVGDKLTILLSDGAGGYGTTTLTTADGVGDGPFSIAVGDVDGDNDNDIAVGNFDTNTVGVFENDGNGNFTAFAGSPFSVGAAEGRPHGVDVADINGDTNLDIITANRVENNISVLLGNGVGGFGLPTNISVGIGPYHVRAADLDDDTDVDLIVPNREDNTVTVLLNNGVGGLVPSAVSPIAVGTGPRFVEVANVVGTLSLDIVVANTDDDSVTVLAGNGAGGFTEAVGSPLGVGDKPNHVTIGDLNGDSNNDIVTTDEAGSNDGNDTLTVLINDGLGGFTRRSLPPGGERVYGSVIADLDGDADNDIAQANADDDNIGIYTNVGAGLPPVAVADNYTTVGGGASLVVAPPGVLNNDSDNESAILYAWKPTVPANGKLINFSPFKGSFTYTPNPGFSGIDTFTYTINDGSQDGNTVAVTITVTP